jgi:amino acid transporter
VIKQALGNTTGNVFLWDTVLAIFVCCLAVQTATIRMLFSMARDNKLPAGSAIARVSGRRKVPAVPALVTGVLTVAILAVNVGNQSAFAAITAVAIILFYMAYLGVTAPMLVRRFRGTWPKPDHGPYFSLGRWGLPVNLMAVLYGGFVVINLAWPRADVYNAYGSPHWYWKWIAPLFMSATVIVGLIYYYAVQVKKPDQVLEEHRASAIELPPMPRGDAMP